MAVVECGTLSRRNKSKNVSFPALVKAMMTVGVKKMPPSSRDPRSYVQAVPLPVPKQTGVKIQARTDVMCNPTMPERDSVRQEHYQRRLVQMSQQGFRSVSYKPYQGIGDPFYLDQKKLILHALGQWREGEEFDSSSSSESEDEDYTNCEKGRSQKNITAANFMLRRTRKDLNTLNNEMGHARSRIRNVRLGHGLFDLVRNEREAKLSAHFREEKKKREALLTEWQPPKNEDDSDLESDDDLSSEVDLRSYMIPYSSTYQGEGSVGMTPAATTPHLLDVPSTTIDSYLDTTRSRVDFQGLDAMSTSTGTADFGPPKSVRSLATSRVSRASTRRKMVTARPYTPQHMNLAAASEQSSLSSDKFSLFRQLCALHWLLEAMNLEGNMVMGPIMTCWHLNEIGGSKISAHKYPDQKKQDHKWKQFMSNPTLRQGGKKYGTGSRLSRSTPRKPSIAPKGSTSSNTSLSGSTSQLNFPGVTSGGNNRLGDVPEDSEVSQQETITEDELEARGPFHFLDEEKDRDDSQSQHDMSSARSERSLSSPVQHGRAEPQTSSEGGDHNSARRQSRSPSPVRLPKRNTDEFINLLDSINRSEEDPRLHALANPREKLSSKDLRADINVRPRSTPAVMEYKSMLPSNRMRSMTMEMRQKFAEVTEEMALVLHDALESKERTRIRVLENKFVHMPTDGTGVHRALIKMRAKSAKDEENREKRRRSSVVHQPWFMELNQNIPDDMKKEWFFQKVLDQLSKYGRVDSSKQSAYKFLKVLTGLRDWEICCPDVSASIEFCREKIVEMSIEEYEEWFQQQFPKVFRPQTAPPTVRASGDKEKKETSTEEQFSVKGSEVKVKVPKSAPHGGRKMSHSKKGS